jgi:hypothetical protein
LQGTIPAGGKNDVRQNTVHASKLARAVAFTQPGVSGTHKEGIFGVVREGISEVHRAGSSGVNFGYCDRNGEFQVNRNCEFHVPSAEDSSGYNLRMREITL